MKYFLILLLASGMIISCSETQIEANSNSIKESAISIRNADNWCDGGQSNPPVIEIVSFSEHSDGTCCINFVYNEFYGSAQTARLMLSDYNFYEETGNNWNNFIDYIPVEFGVVDQICIPQAYGSHFAIELYSGTCEEDRCLGYLGCNSFEIPC